MPDPTPPTAGAHPRRSSSSTEGTPNRFLKTTCRSGCLASRACGGEAMRGGAGVPQRPGDGRGRQARPHPDPPSAGACPARQAVLPIAYLAHKWPYTVQIVHGAGEWHVHTHELPQGFHRGHAPCHPRTSPGAAGITCPWQCTLNCVPVIDDNIASGTTVTPWFLLKPRAPIAPTPLPGLAQITSPSRAPGLAACTGPASSARCAQHTLHSHASAWALQTLLEAEGRHLWMHLECMIQRAVLAQHCRLKCWCPGNAFQQAFHAPGMHGCPLCFTAS